MPDARKLLREQIAAVLRQRSGSPVEDVADEVYGLIEHIVDGNVAAYEKVVTSRCAKTHARKGPAPCSDCRQRITIAKTVRTTLLPPTPPELGN